MRLADLNGLDRDAATEVLLRCCGSTRWAQSMADARPFADAEALFAQGEAAWSSLETADWLEAFAAHPQIGSTGSTGSVRTLQPDAGAELPAPPAKATAWSDQEQAGVVDAGDSIRRRLSAGNAEYAARFGYIFIICATGQAAADMLDALERRLRNDPGMELGVAAAEQRNIIRLRLAKLIATE
jgi:2-oxo-4-hydroxy-4-carboxy-5-ureidoimidazoline decarboxylase